MKIVQINSTYGDADSTGRTTKEMHLWLSEHQVDSVVYSGSLNDGKLPPENVSVFTKPIHRKIHALLSRLTGMQGYFSIWDTWKLLHEMDKQKPDIVVLRVLHSNIINFSMLFRNLKKRNIPVVFVLHDSFFYTGHCCHYLDYPCEKWGGSCSDCKHMRDWNKSWFFRTAEKCLRNKEIWYKDLLCAVVGVSKWITEDARNSIMKHADFIEYIYNWIDFKVFFPRESVESVRKELKVEGNKKIILAVASVWTDGKGLQEVLTASRVIENAVVVVIGNAYKGFYEEGNIIYVGKVSDLNRLAELYSAADVFINASLEEAFGKTTAEALSCGTPVVAYATSGSKELVNDLRGAIVPLKNVDQFMEKTREVLDRGKEWYQSNCLDFAEQNFEMDRNIEQYLRLFNELCKNRMNSETDIY